MPKRKTAKDYHALATQRGFRWLGEALPQNVDHKSQWECSKGHRWLTSYSLVLRGKGCPHCYGKMRSSAHKTTEG